jgi:membrane-associated protein
MNTVATRRAGRSPCGSHPEESQGRRLPIGRSGRHAGPRSVRDMIDILESAITSPWVYLALFAIAVLDGFFPVVPSETMVITAGVFAAGGEPHLAGVIAVAALGAFVGDHISYWIGRRAGAGMVRRSRPGSRRRAAFAWAANALAVRGGLLLVVARYVPGGRTAATMTTGAVGYPLRRFTAFDALAAGSWALYSALVGYVGGAAFEHDTVKGLAFGLGLAAGITVLVEVVRFVRARSLHKARLVRDDRRLHPVAHPEPGEDRAHVALHCAVGEK